MRAPAEAAAPVSLIPTDRTSFSLDQYNGQTMPESRHQQLCFIPKTSINCSMPHLKQPRALQRPRIPRYFHIDRHRRALAGQPSRMIMEARKVSLGCQTSRGSTRIFPSRDILTRARLRSLEFQRPQPYAPTKYSSPRQLRTHSGDPTGRDAA